MKIIEKIKEIIARIFKPNLKMIEAHKEYNEDIDISLIDPEEDEYDELMFGKKTKVIIKEKQYGNFYI